MNVQLLSEEQEIAKDQYLLERKYNTFKGVSRKSTYFVEDRETGLLVPLDREKDFNPRIHRKLARPIPVAEKVAPAIVLEQVEDGFAVPVGMEVVGDEMEAKKARYEELKQSRAWLSKEEGRAQEYAALKAELGL